MKGKIAVITGCHWCPYKAFDNTMGIIIDNTGVEQQSSEVVYCGYHKIGFDGSQINLDKIINSENYIENWKPTEQEQDYPTMPNNCPLPEGDDGRSRYGK